MTVEVTFVTPGPADYHIHAASAIADDRTRVLKQNDTFAVFDRYGDILRVGLGEQGVYSGNTRHLSLLALRVNEQRPLLLSSTLSRDNSLLSVDLANPEIEDEGAPLPAEVVHLLRSTFIWEGSSYERLEVHNYGLVPVHVTLTYDFAADFADIFEVRGMRREHRGSFFEAEVGLDDVRLPYLGLDRMERSTLLSFAPTPVSLTASTARFEFDLEPHEQQRVTLAVTCSSDERMRPELSYDQARRRSAGALEEASKDSARVVTSSPHFNEWINRARADLNMMTTVTDSGPFVYAGVPWFNTAFGRDALISALATLWFQPSMAAGVLRYLAAMQATELDAERDAEPGKILHETRKGEMAALGEVPFARYYGSVDATPLFIVLAGEYFETTADRALIEELWPNIVRALDWLDEYGDVDGDGFVEYGATAHGLENQGWKDSHDAIFHADGVLAAPPIALAEVQAYVYSARRHASRLANMLGHVEQSAELEERAEALRERFEAVFWSEELGTYALALDGEKRPCLVRASNAGHCLWGGIVPRERVRSVADALLAEDSFTGWGVRTVAAGQARYNPMSYHNGSVWPHDSAIIAEGLARNGRKDGALDILTGLFDASQALELHRLPELLCGFARRPGAGPTLYPVACSPQSWAAASVFLMLKACLGMTIDAPRGRLLFDQPVLPEWLERVSLLDVRVGEHTIDLDLHRFPDDVGISVTRRSGPIEVIATK